MADAVIALVRESAVLADEGSPDQRPLVDLNDLPTGVYVTVGILLLAVVLIAILVVIVTTRHVKRSSGWRRAKLLVQSEALTDSPRRELIRLRLRLDDALAGATSAVTTSDDIAVADNLDLVNQHLQVVGRRIAHQLDALAGTHPTSTVERLLGPLDSRVQDIERLALQIIDAAAAAMAGSADIELEDVTRAVSEELETIDLRLDALRGLSKGAPTPPTP